MEWWRDEAGRALMRDYFRVESREGVRVWLYPRMAGTIQQPYAALVRAWRVRMSNVVAFPDKDKRPRRDRSAQARSVARLCGACRHHQFLVPARRIASRRNLMRQAVALGLTGIGIADRNSVAGVVRAYSALEEFNENRMRAGTRRDLPALKLAVGARLVFADGTPDILAYPQNRAAWGRLTRLLTVGKSRGEKGRMRPVSRRSARAHRGPQSHRDAARAAQRRTRLVQCSRACKSRVVPATRLARRQHAVSRRRQPPARAAQGHRRASVRSADRRERRALSRARAAGLAGRHDLHPRARHDRHGRPPARSQCRAASEIAAGDGAAVPPRAGGDRPDAALPRPLQFLARRTEEDRISRREPRRLSRRRRMRWWRSPRKALSAAIPTASARKSATRSTANSRSPPSSNTRPTSSPSTTSSTSRAPKASCARGADRRRIPSSAIASASPR